MTARVCATGLLSLLLLSSSCAGAFLPRSEPIDLGPDQTLMLTISVEGSEDMPEWGEVLWGELAQTLSALRGVKVVEPAPGVLLVNARIDSWDFQERIEERLEPPGRTRLRRPDPYRECTALMGVTVDISDPTTGKVLAQRKYLGVERDVAEMHFGRVLAPRPLVRRAAGKVASQLADDLEAGRR